MQCKAVELVKWSKGEKAPDNVTRGNGGNVLRHELYDVKQFTSGQLIGRFDGPRKSETWPNRDTRKNTDRENATGKKENQKATLRKNE